MSTRDADVQAAFVELLHQPLLTAARHPVEYQQVLRHKAALTDHARKFGYVLRSVGAAVRLERMPLAGTVAHPPAPAGAPTARVMALACLIAAACEDTDGAVTLADLSSAVQSLTATAGETLAPYDPDNQAHRRQLVAAVDLLCGHGVLLLRSGADAIESWRETRQGAGAGYEVDRAALLLMTNPDVLSRATAPVEPDALDDSRQLRLLRILLETPALLYADLDPADADRARSQRGFLKTPVVRAVGGHIEDRAEGMVLIVGDPAAPSPLRIDFPAARSESWAALLAVDAAGQNGTRDDAGRVHVTGAQVDTLLDELVEDRGQHLATPLRTNRAALRTAVERVLHAVGLITAGPDDGWVLSPVAGRYRAPEVRISTGSSTHEEDES